MVTSTSRIKLTSENYWSFPEEGPRREIIDGELFVTPAPFVRHQRLVLRLATLIQTHLDEHPLGEVLPSPCAVVLSEVDVVEPDLLFVSAERADRVTPKEVRGAPDLVVEILSDSTKRTDEREKRRLYEKSGVREYWIVDPVNDAVQVLRQGTSGFAPAEELTGENRDLLTTPLLPGLTIPLARLFR